MIKRIVVQFELRFVGVKLRFVCGLWEQCFCLIPEWSLVFSGYIFCYKIITVYIRQSDQNQYAYYRIVWLGAKTNPFNNIKIQITILISGETKSGHIIQLEELWPEIHIFLIEIYMLKQPFIQGNRFGIFEALRWKLFYLFLNVANIAAVNNCAAIWKFFCRFRSDGWC